MILDEMIEERKKTIEILKEKNVISFISRIFTLFSCEKNEGIFFLLKIVGCCDPLLRVHVYHNGINTVSHVFSVRGP